MRAAQEGVLPLTKNMELMEIIEKQSEIIERLVWLDRKLLNLLGQYMGVEEYEQKLTEILQGNDGVI